jgi:hypothetical protein
LGWAFALGLATVSFGWAQKTEKVPQILIDMRSVPKPEQGEVAFSVNAGQFYSYNLPIPAGPQSKPDHEVTVGGYGRGVSQQRRQVLTDYVIEAVVDRTPADRVRAVMLIPGCETQSFDIAIEGKSEIHQEAKCVRTPVWKFNGRIVDDGLTDTKWLMVRVAYEAAWAPGFLGVEKTGVDQPPPEPPVFDVVSVPVAKDKSFSIDLPILAHDPAEENAGKEKRGECVFTLLNVYPKVPVALGTLRPDKFATEAGGLELRIEYPELQFVVEHGQ